MTDQERANRDIKREMMSRVWTKMNSPEFSGIALPELKAMVSVNQATYDSIVGSQTRIVASSKGATAKAAAMDWIVAVEQEYEAIRQSLNMRIAQLEQADNRADNEMPRAEQRDSPALPPPEGLTQFDGNHANWPSFRDLFIALVHSRPYPNLNKLLYLKKACIGPAALAISGYEPLQDCYKDAWESLRAIYDDDYAVGQALVGRLLDMKPAHNASVGELRRIIDTTTSTLRQLDSLRYKVRHWDPMIIGLMARRLAPQVVGSWEQQRKRDKTPKLKDFLEFLDAKARAQSYEIVPATSTSNECMVSHQQARPSGGYQGSKQASGEQGSRPLFRSQSGSRCANCGQGTHWLAACPSLLAEPQKERRHILLNLGVCLNCLRFGHYRFKCERPGCRTKFCSGDKHHAILCEKSNYPRPIPKPEVKRTAEKRPRKQ